MNVCSISIQQLFKLYYFYYTAHPRKPAKLNMSIDALFLVLQRDSESHANYIYRFTPSLTMDISHLNYKMVNTLLTAAYKMQVFHVSAGGSI